MPKKRLPIGIQTFREIREDGCYYVDKTGFALRLIEQGKAFFLSRPRRFGKSLFIDTLAELFAGNEPLFRGLEAHDRWDWERRFPVVRLSFAEGVLHSRSELDEKATELLAENERRLGVSGDAPSLSGRFSQLLRLAEERHGERVVVLVDEYDKPILDNLSDPDIRPRMLLFQKRQFRPWWFETATPTFLIELLRERQAWLPNLGQMAADAELLSAFDVDRISTQTNTGPKVCRSTSSGSNSAARGAPWSVSRWKVANSNCGRCVALIHPTLLQMINCAIS